MIYLNDQALAWQEGMTVTDLLKSIDDAHHYAVVRVNGRYVSRPQFNDYIIPDSAEIFLIPMVVGG